MAEPRSSDESYFAFEELFFSRTDAQGRILSGNDIFQRVSGYHWNELLHKPHNLIRHPDMPRAVFHLLWETILKGKPIGAYVKNRSKDGKYYWVFALVLPLGESFLSVRLKPSSEFFKLIQTEYANLRRHELSTQISPKDSQALLLKRVRELGFETYELFMAEALIRELEARRVQMKENPSPILRQLAELASLGGKLFADTEASLISHHTNRFVPLNLAIQSSRVEDEQNSIGVVAMQYQELTTEIEGRIRDVQNMANEVLGHVRKTQFLLAANMLQMEVVDLFKRQVQDSTNDRDLEMRLLNDVCESYSEQARVALSAVQRSLSQFRRITENMRSLTTALEMVRLAGKIESSRLVQDPGAFDNLIEQLRIFQTTLAEVVRSLGAATGKMHSLSTSLYEDFNAHSH